MSRIITMPTIHVIEIDRGAGKTVFINMDNVVSLAVDQIEATPEESSTLLPGKIFPAEPAYTKIQVLDVKKHEFFYHSSKPADEIRQSIREQIEGMVYRDW